MKRITRSVLFSLAGAVLYALFTSLSVRGKTDTLVTLLVYDTSSAVTFGVSLPLQGLISCRTVRR